MACRGVWVSISFPFAGSTCVWFYVPASNCKRSCFFRIVVAFGGGFDFGGDLSHTSLMSVFLPAPLYNGGIILINGNGFSSTKHVDGGIFRVKPRSSAITVPPVRMAMSSTWFLAIFGQSFHGGNLKCPTQFVYYQGSWGFTFYIFGNDQWGICLVVLPVLGWHRSLSCWNLLVVQQDHGIFQFGLHFSLSVTK